MRKKEKRCENNYHQNYDTISNDVDHRRNRMTAWFADLVEKNLLLC